MDLSENLSFAPNKEEYIDELKESFSGSIRPHGNQLKPPLLGHYYKVPILPKKHYEETILDMSLPKVAVYSCLKTYDLEPVNRPKTPESLAKLREHFAEASDFFQNTPH